MFWWPVYHRNPVLRTQLWNASGHFGGGTPVWNSLEETSLSLLWGRPDTQRVQTASDLGGEPRVVYSQKPARLLATSPSLPTKQEVLGLLRVLPEPPSLGVYPEHPVKPGVSRDREETGRKENLTTWWGFWAAALFVILITLVYNSYKLKHKLSQETRLK